MDREGPVCLANRGPGTNSSQFFITLGDCSALAPRHAVFAHRVGACPANAHDKPFVDAVIWKCSEIEFPGS